ncbi:hypothetical protein Catovirus_1_286 [Catovirus CTV1]|uniref:Uncharacterized protein n=1 Tax=Catovirus CTV1 TaxID=1977631 RepID=A0A1V0S954_9VIRU|nr:hypothetical protein Catovirus_1_286 [Catovirus CTV1]
MPELLFILFFIFILLILYYAFWYKPYNKLEIDLSVITKSVDHLYESLLNDKSISIKLDSEFRFLFTLWLSSILGLPFKYEYDYKLNRRDFGIIMNEYKKTLDTLNITNKDNIATKMEYHMNEIVK